MYFIHINNSDVNNIAPIPIPINESMINNIATNNNCKIHASRALCHLSLNISRYIQISTINAIIPPNGRRSAINTIIIDEMNITKIVLIKYVLPPSNFTAI